MKLPSSKPLALSAILVFMLTSCGGGSTEEAPTNTQPVAPDETEEPAEEIPTWGSTSWGDDEWSDESNIIITWSSSTWD